MSKLNHITLSNTSYEIEDSYARTTIEENERVTAAALTTLADDKADKATTLAGYGITDANISNGTITLGSNTITPITDVSDKEDVTPIVAVASGSTTIAAEVNKYYEVAGTVSSLTVTLPTPTANTEVTMVVVHLTVGASPTVVVTSVNEVVKFSAAYSVIANKEYELSCLYNGSKWIVSSMEVTI